MLFGSVAWLSTEILNLESLGKISAKWFQEIPYDGSGETFRIPSGPLPTSENMTHHSTSLEPRDCLCPWGYNSGLALFSEPGLGV
jgi:hypothetical protein